MPASTTIIPIHTPATGPAETPSGCGRCAHSEAGPICRVEPGTALRQGPIELEGPPAQLASVLAVLRRELAVTQQQAPLPLEAIVQRLSLDPECGEAELVLAVAPRCGGLRLAETAFQILRRVLPQTDIYVRHASP